MPHVELDTPTGMVNMHYVISTPDIPNASSIAPELPTILFLHSAYISHYTFEPQFSDPLLRQFNLVAPDMRGYGSTTGPMGDPYSPTESASDIYKFMVALNIPPCHIFGLSIGSCIALELASAHPDCVLSLTLCSPLPSVELDEVQEGRQEIFEYHKSAVQNEPTDLTIEEDAEYGEIQFCFNNQITRIVKVITDTELARTHRVWGSDSLEECYRATVSWFVRKPRTQEALAKITCPVRIIHCADDIAYPFELAQELERELREAGVVRVDLKQVPGPHYGSVVNAADINPLIEDLILSISNPPTRESTPKPRSVPPTLILKNLNGTHSNADSFDHNHSDHSRHTRLPTPFMEMFAQLGIKWTPHDDHHHHHHHHHQPQQDGQREDEANEESSESNSDSGSDSEDDDFQFIHDPLPPVVILVN
ncbi:alpha/beta-hydrolase [Pluteus cervinus]|uniref:Alpha/beta-hydrolase n=1 Tax=Pluteus cervinus TaxID=181527 RepID=A0ACD3BAZ6_9AGAR|nr:alpha/beta-hydrolase [Pluteus cervinus]